MKRVDSKSINGLSRVFDDIIRVETDLRTYGLSSYSSFALNIALRHKIENQSKGFMNVYGIHTNNVETF